MGNERTWRNTTYVTLIVLGVLFVALAATGIVLGFRYQPGRSDPVRGVHAAAAYLFMLTGVVFAISAITLFGIRRHWAYASIPMVTGILAVATVLTGVVLPWDQLALRAVTINSSYRGYVDLLHGDSVRYVVIDNSEIGIGAFRMWFWGHAVLLPFVVAFLLLLTVRIVRRGGRLSGAENAP